MSGETIFFKPGLTMDQPIDITLSAADWLVFTTWLSDQNSEMINHLYRAIAIQVREKLYDQASVKAAMARHAEHSGPPTLGDILGQAGIVFRMGPEGIEPIDPNDLLEGNNDDDDHS